MKKAVIYTRVSDPSQISGKSLDVQRDKCEKWAKENGVEIVGIYEDGGKSGTRTVGRDALAELIERCKKEHIDYALTIDTDRIARNEWDHFYIRKELEKVGTKYIAINQPMIDDSPEGRLIDTMLAGINAFQSRLTGRKVKLSLMRKWEQGDYPSWAPLGYINVDRGTKEKPDKRIEIDPVAGPLITRLFELYATGNYSLLQLAKKMYGLGLPARKGKPICDSTLQQILTNTFYYGWMRWNSLEKQGNHKPLVTKELYDQCQYVAAQHRQFLIRIRKHTFLLRGFVICNVHQHRLTAEWHKVLRSQHRTKISYYRCTNSTGCKGSYVDTEKTEHQVAESLKRYEFSEEFTEIVKEEAKKQLSGSRERITSTVQGLTNQKKALTQKRDSLEDLLVEGTLDKESYARQHTKIIEEISFLENKIADVESQRGLDIKLIEEILSLSRNIYKTYTQAPDFLKRHYLRIFYEAIYIQDKKIVKYAETPILSELRKSYQVRIRSSLLPRRDSNPEPCRYKNPSVTKRLGLSHHPVNREPGI